MSVKCFLCGKGSLIARTGRHHPGVAGGQWKKRAQKKATLKRPNLQNYHGRRYCITCLRQVKALFLKQKKAVAADSPSKTA
jgi:hypothetical protein